MKRRYLRGASALAMIVAAGWWASTARAQLALEQVDGTVEIFEVAQVKQAAAAPAKDAKDTTVAKDTVGEKDAADAKVAKGIDGGWALEVKTDDGQTLTATMKLSKDGDKLVGTYTGMDGKEVKAEDLSLKDNELAFTVKLDFQGTDLVAKFKLKHEGGKLKGKVDYDLGGQTGTLDVDGKRGGEAAKPAGTWDIEVVTDDGQTLKSTLKLAKDGDKFKGMYAGMDGKEVKAEDLVVKDGDLAFTVKLDFQGTDLVAKFKLKQDGDKLKGKVDYDLGGQTGTLDVAGKRAGGGEVKLAGTWAMEVKTDDGQTLKSTIKFTKDGEKVAGTLTGADGKEAKVEESKLSGDELAFKISLDFDGTPLVAKFKGKLAGDAYKGKVDYDLGGQTGSLPFEAKRSGD
jgi:hypothetical protein